VITLYGKFVKYFFKCAAEKSKIIFLKAKFMCFYLEKSDKVGLFEEFELCQDYGLIFRAET
jgi:hypothetical protein